MNIIPSIDLETVGRHIADRLIAHLSLGEKVLWLIPGGSSIPAATVAARDIIASGIAYQGLLTVTLTDERFGPVGHPDSNWQQLLDSGFTLPGARLISILTSADGITSREETTKVWGIELAEVLTSSNYILGLFGIGADGHIAGMLPHTTPLDSTELADSYSAGKFERITITPHVMKKISETVAFATGPEKQATLLRLKNEDLPMVEQPAQQLKQASEFTLFTDCKI